MKTLIKIRNDRWERLTFEAEQKYEVESSKQKPLQWRIHEKSYIYYLQDQASHWHHKIINETHEEWLKK